MNREKANTGRGREDFCTGLEDEWSNGCLMDYRR
jgi:hypothetical protein